MTSKYPPELNAVIARAFANPDISAEFASEALEIMPAVDLDPPIPTAEFLNALDQVRAGEGQKAEVTLSHAVSRGVASLDPTAVRKLLTDARADVDKGGVKGLPADRAAVRSIDAAEVNEHVRRSKTNTTSLRVVKLQNSQQKLPSCQLTK